MSLSQHYQWRALQLRAFGMPERNGVKMTRPLGIQKVNYLSNNLKTDQSI